MTLDFIAPGSRVARVHTLNAYSGAGTITPSSCIRHDFTTSGVRDCGSGVRPSARSGAGELRMFKSVTSGASGTAGLAVTTST